jgi:hypothetical protein
VADGGNEAAGVDVEEGLRLFVGVDLDVLVGDLLVFEGYPYALDEGAGTVSMVSMTLWDCMYIALKCRDMQLTRMHCRTALNHLP